MVTNVSDSESMLCKRERSSTCGKAICHCPYVTDVHNSLYGGLWLADRGLVPGTDKAPTVPLVSQ
uniref:Uncharacterized protein n=1 Tax=Trichinella nativa TaxID=6335 RepID=A0A0V1KJA5_9BILA